MENKEYYCDTCLNLYGELILLIQEKRDAPNGKRVNYIGCPKCGGGWRINKGTIRHHVRAKLNQWKKLAKQLGILEE